MGRNDASMGLTAIRRTAVAELTGRVTLWGLCVIALSLVGCGTLPNGHRWGEDATLWPGFSRLGSSALQAARDPVTWLPAAGAVVFDAGKLDNRVSNWASEHTPLFGSVSGADRTSTILMDATCAGAFVTALAAPSGSEAGPWMIDKLKGGGIEIAGVGMAGGLTSLIKQAAGRQRPDGSNSNSFPSGHSTGAFGCAALAGQNIETLSLPHSGELALRGGFLLLATGTAWARVEAKKHYPSDVLAGAALGNFITRFIHDTFLGLDRRDAIDISVAPSRDGVLIGLTAKF
jgi:PAP2 superfamily